MKFSPLVTALAILAATVLPALADVGSTTTTTTVYADKSTNMGVVGTLPAGTYVEGSCYRDGWCQIVGGGIAGWVTNDTVVLSSIAQPQPPQAEPPPRPVPQPQPEPPPRPQQPAPSFPWPQPQPQPQPPRPPQPQPPVYQDAGACFFSERSYRGSSFCLDADESYSRLRNWDNKIRSVQVFGGAVVDLCTDANFYGNCVTIRSNTTRLPSSLDRRASSLEVY